MSITYRKRKPWKYTLSCPINFATGMRFEANDTKDGEYLGFTVFGTLIIKKGYAWDGASFIVKDTKTIMRASLIHDAITQLIYEGVLPQSARKRADEIMRDIMIEDGVNRFRAWAIWKGLRIGGAKSCRSKTLTAP